MATSEQGVPAEIQDLAERDALGSRTHQRHAHPRGGSRAARPVLDAFARVDLVLHAA